MSVSILSKKYCNILVISPSKFPGYTGDTSNYTELVFGLKSESYNVILLCPKLHNTKNYDNKMRIKGINIIRIPFMPPRKEDMNNKSIFILFLKFILFNIINIFTTTMLLLKIKIKVVVMRHSLLTISILPILKIFNIKIIADGELITYNINKKYTLHKLAIFMEKLLLNFYTYFKISTKKQKLIMMDYGIHPSKIIYSNISIDVSKVPIYDIETIPECTFGFFGAIEKWQGIDFLLCCFSKVIKIKPNAKLYIIGEGSLKTQAFRFITEKKLHKNIFILSSVPREILWKKYFKLFRILIIPRPPLNIPVQPIKIVEALASGKPVIATSVEGINEIRSKGIFFVKYDEEEMINSIISFCNNNKKIAKFSNNAINSAKIFDIKLEIEKIIKLLNIE